MKIIKQIIIIISFLSCCSSVYANDFLTWKNDFKKYALKEGISLKTVNDLIDNSKFLPEVIKYDRFQPEFYEDTKTYISKRTSDKKLAKGKIIYKKINF